MRTLLFIVIVLFSTVMVLLACGGKAVDYHPQTEIPKGPGVFSGKEGEFTVYDSKTASEKKESAAETDIGQQSAEATAGAAAAGAAVQSDEAKEFEEFQRWKKEKAEFEEFQKWKQSEQGAAEYQEFKQWQKWREYKKWQESQKPAQ